MWVVRSAKRWWYQKIAQKAAAVETNCKIAVFRLASAYTGCGWKACREAVL